MKRFLANTFFILFSCLISAFVAHAQSYTPLVQLPGTLIQGTATTNLSTYLAGAIKLLVALGAALAVLFAIIGGTQYVAASINPSAKKDAMERIQRALLGLGIILTSYLLLNSINPKLVQFNFMLPAIGVAPGVAPANMPTVVGVNTLSNGSTNPIIQPPAQVSSPVPPLLLQQAPIAQSILDESNVDPTNDYSIITHCLTAPTYGLCPKADFNKDGKTDSADFMLFVERGALLDFNMDKKVETSPASVPTSCYFKTSTASLPGTLARRNICLDGNGYNRECVNEQGVFYGKFVNDTLSLVGVNHMFSGSGVGYRDLPSPPTLNFSVAPLSMSTTTDITLQWNPVNATSCSASGAWSGSKTATSSASQKIKVATSGSYDYTLSCSGRGGSTTQTSTVVYDKTGATQGSSGVSTAVVASTAVPTATITVVSTSLLQNSATITWSSTLTTSCTASGGWSGIVATSGSASGSLSGTTATTYYLTCQGPGGSVTASATANLNSTRPWIASSELGSACALNQGLMNMLFGYDFTGNGQYTKFQQWITSASSGNSVDLNKLFSKIFWVVSNTGGTPTLRFVETTLGKLSYATIAQYDLNNDGIADFGANGADIAAFEECKGKAVAGACAQADFNGDGVIDSHDLMFRDLVMRDIYSQPVSVLLGYATSTNTGTGVTGTGSAIYGQSFSFVPYRWVLNQFESMLFDPARYTDKQIVQYCVGHKPFERCAQADVDESCRAQYLSCGTDMACRAQAETCTIGASDASKFDTEVTQLDINGDGKVDLQ